MGCGASNTAAQIDEPNPPASAEDVDALKDKLAQQEETEDTNNVDKLSTVQMLAESLQSQGKSEEALPFSRRAVQGRREELGLVHVDTLASMRTLDKCLGCSQDKPPSEEAVTELKPLYEELNNQLKSSPKDADTLALHKVAYDGCSSALGVGHKTSLKLHSSLATRLDNTGRTEEALESYRSVLEAQRKQLGSDHLSTLATLMNYGALVLVQEKDGRKAACLLRPAAEGYRKKLGPEDRRTQAAEAWLTKAQQAQGVVDEDGRQGGELEGARDESLIQDQQLDEDFPAAAASLRGAEQDRVDREEVKDDVKAEMEDTSPDDDQEDVKDDVKAEREDVSPEDNQEDVKDDVKAEREDTSGEHQMKMMVA
ncbi:hypothetical protein CEUSTIGMA_g980.t1 [Chlamydomonas eustigma]|uniref:Kinesin light chain n=1 Tax=Chlamydomonas eustigma TaxID=1157962 RepID=A0A250WRR8_9CHLO|nr:hypothetical protein CEUSTIGMA_g980.t1 [Chlamydomonas eustigma]|eukprot:GAX73528.1 hypothetical protein CEUSTIGMA_g980.t1 [Chlamydomonas eustigma]